MICYANMNFAERADEYAEFDGAELIALDEKTVAEILSVAFGSRFDVKMLAFDQNSVLLSDDVYYILTKDHAWVDAIPFDEELQYVFTLMGETESIDGTAQVTVEETAQNSVGLTLTSLTAQKSE